MTNIYQSFTYTMAAKIKWLVEQNYVIVTLCMHTATAFIVDEDVYS